MMLRKKSPGDADKHNCCRTNPLPLIFTPPPPTPPNIEYSQYVIIYHNGENIRVCGGRFHIRGKGLLKPEPALEALAIERRKLDVCAAGRRPRWGGGGSVLRKCSGTSCK